MSASEAITAYVQLAGNIFSEKNSRAKDGTFKASNLERAVKSVLKANESHEDARMCEEDTGKECRAWVSPRRPSSRLIDMDPAS